MMIFKLKCCISAQSCSSLCQNLSVYVKYEKLHSSSVLHFDAILIFYIKITRFVLITQALHYGKVLHIGTNLFFEIR